jgi:hypothetical protein
VSGFVAIWFAMSMVGLICGVGGFFLGRDYESDKRDLVILAYRLQNDSGKRYTLDEVADQLGIDLDEP